MQSPSLPVDEILRLRALQETGLLGTPPEERFDRLTRAAKQALGVPVALISLLDADRQWFKSRQGTELQETSRAISFCGHAILGPDIFEVPDARQDPRFADNPLVTGPPYVRFYAGAPLATRSGQRIGTLCVIADTPRRLTAAERSLLRDLADCVEAEIDRQEIAQLNAALAHEQRLNQVITRAQALFIRESDRHRAFEGLLEDLLALTDSAYGFIGEVLRDPHGQPYLKTHAITNIAWDAQTRALLAGNRFRGLEFRNLRTLFGAALASGEPVIANDPANDPRRGGLPPGHPPLQAFLGVPVYHGDQLLAMFGLANRPGGYDRGLLDYLQPLTATVGQLVHAERIRQQHERDQAELARLSRVASETTNGVVITDAQGRVQWVNAGFTRITGYELAELAGRKPGELLQGPETDPAQIAAMRAALARQEGFEVEVLNYTKDGRQVWMHISCNPLTDAQGQLQGFMAIQSDVTQERRTKQALRQFRNTLDQTLDCVFMFDAQTLRFFYANEGALRQVGYQRAELMVMHPYDIKPEYPPQRFRELIAPLVAGQVATLTFDTVHRRKDGQQVPVEVFLQYFAQPGERPHFVAIVRDISERKRIETALTEQAQYTQAIIDNMVDGVITIDARGIMQACNKAAQRIFGYATEELLGHNVSLLMPSPHRERHDTYLQNYLATGVGRVIGQGREVEGVRKNGERFPLQIAISEITHQGQTQFVGLVSDITERKRSEAQLRHMATHDALTGLPNRTLFLEHLSHEIARAKREGGLVAVLLLDLDDFKLVNDSFGHHQGDALLVEVAARLGRAVRDSDVIARLGGDEFVVILAGLEDEAQVRRAAERLVQVLHEPVLIDGRAITPTASVGYSLFPDDADSPDNLLRHADSAMYAAKAAGHGRVSAYQAHMQEAAADSLHIVSRLRQAVAHGDFELFYQPQVDMRSGRIVGAEALLRWNDAELGAVSPDRFVPVAESSGLILPLGQWVLDSACAQIAAWHAEGLSIPVAVNLSPYQLLQPDLLQIIKDACARHGCPPALLELEITETAAMQSPELTRGLFAALVESGFSLALDDFGTGYSSLARLGQMHVNKLKIDRSFITNIPGEPMSEALVRTIITMGKEMGMRLVAEGVETPQQRDFLAQLGCTVYQGWLFSKAVPAERLRALLERSLASA